MDPAIRRMHAGEAAAVSALLLRANENNLAAFPPEVARSYRAELLDVARRAAGAETYVLPLDRSVAGSVTFVPDAAADTHPWPAGGSVLRFLAVDPPVRGRGLGQRLTTCCVERAREQGAGFLALHTAPTMLAARRLYERLGFQRAPRHDFDPDAHYGAGARAQEPAWGLAYLLELDAGAPASGGPALGALDG